MRLKAESDDGGWYPNVADHYRYALSQPEVSGVLCSFLQPAHLDELLAGLDDGALTIEQQKRFEMLAGWG